MKDCELGFNMDRIINSDGKWLLNYYMVALVKGRQAEVMNVLKHVNGSGPFWKEYEL